MRTWLGFSLLVLFTVVACASESSDGARARDTDPTESDRDTSGTTPVDPGEGASTSSSSSSSGAPTVEAPPSTIVVTTEALDVAGAARSYVLGVPSTYDASRAYPLVLGFHGDGGDGAGIRAALSFEAVSGQDAIVAYPSGHGHTWDLYGPAATNGDVDFITKLVGALEQRFNVTPDRVFGIGFSNGAFMLNQLACRRPSLFRAIVPLSGGAPYEPQDSGASHWENGYVKCAGQTLGSGPAVLVVHGTQDAVVSYESGDFSAKYWSYVNGCGEASSAWSIQPCVSYAECPTGKSVLFCPIAAMGHAIWSEATKAAWTFFSGL